MTTFLFVRHAHDAPVGTATPACRYDGTRARARGREPTCGDRHATYVFTQPAPARVSRRRDEIALVLGLEVLVDERLRERTNWGDVPGETFERVPRSVGTRRRACVTRAHGRIRGRHRGRYPRATIIVVAHGGIVGDYLGGHEDWPHCGVTEFAA